MSSKPVPLDHLLNRVSGHVSVRGIEYPVTACNAIDFQIIQRARSADPTLTMPEALALAQKLCPGLPQEVWETADTVIVGVIFGVSQAKAEEVEADLPNSSGPASQTPPAASPEG